MSGATAGKFLAALDGFSVVRQRKAEEGRRAVAAMAGGCAGPDGGRAGRQFGEVRWLNSAT